MSNKIKAIAIFMVLSTLLLTIGCQEVQEQTICPSCGEKVVVSEYCSKCGQPLSSYKEVEVHETNAPETDAPEKPATQGLEYTISNDGTYSVSVGTARYTSDIVIPSQYNGKSVTGISAGAFSGCTSLVSITIPESVTRIGSFAFSDCTSLVSINVEKNNPNFSSENGVLFDKNKTRLDMYPIGITAATYTIPESVTEINGLAFSGCTNLTSITIPNNVTTITVSAFSGCTNLNTIKYNGTVAQWSLVKKGSKWNHKVPAMAVVCSDGKAPIK